MSQPKLNQTADAHLSTQLDQTNRDAETAPLETKSKTQKVLALFTSLLALLLSVTDSTLLDF